MSNIALGPLDFPCTLASGNSFWLYLTVNPSSCPNRDTVVHLGYLITIYIFKASALWADAFYKSKCPSLCLSVCLFVHF